jgi:hypothetical protein
MSNPIDPFDILNDIQFFQESDFTSKMMNSPSYRHLYTHLFNTMNNPPLNINPDHVFRPIKKSKHSIPVIHSTMANDWFLNELIDLYEQEDLFYFQSASFPTDPFTYSEKNLSGHRQHEQQYRCNKPNHPFEFKK